MLKYQTKMQKNASFSFSNETLERIYLDNTTYLHFFLIDKLLL